MPYEIREREKGFQVCKKGSRRCYSNDPLPLNRAERQLRALYSAEADMEGAGFFGNLLKRTFTGITDFIVRPRGFDPAKHTQGWLRRPFDMPPLDDLAKMVASTYKEGDPRIQGYTLLSKTPTVSFFQVNRKRNVIIIALRGTAFTDINDISADLGIVKTIVEDANTARNVRNSQRYINDVKTIKDFQNTASQYLPRPSANLVYYAVGHSLSGAMIDELLDDGLVKSAVSFNPAIERVNFAKDNNNHRVYLSCDVLYNLLGKFITNGNLEVVEKENPAGADAGAIDASKGTIKCHNIETVIPYMSGKGIENNFSNEYKPMSFQDLINRSSSFRGDKFKPIGRQTECMATREYAPCFDEEGNMYNNPSSARCAGKKCVSNARSVARGGGFLDTVGKFMSFAEKGRKAEAEELDENWRGSILGKVGIPNPMKLFGGAKPSHMLSREEAERRFYEGDGRPFTKDEWEAKLCKGSNSLLSQKYAKIDERERKAFTREAEKRRKRQKREDEKGRRAEEKRKATPEYKKAEEEKQTKEDGERAELSKLTEQDKLGLYVFDLEEADVFLPTFPYKYIDYDEPDRPAYVWVQAKRDDEGEEKDDNRWVQFTIRTDMLGDRLGQQYHKTKKAKDYFKGLMKVVKARDEEKPARTQSVGNPEELYRKQERRSELDIESGWEKYDTVLKRGGRREDLPAPLPNPPPRPPRPVVPLNRQLITRVNAEMRRLTNLDNGNHAGRFFLRSILENYYGVVLRNYIRSTTANRANELGALLNDMIGMTSALVGGEDRNTVRELNSAVAAAVLRANGEDED